MQDNRALSAAAALAHEASRNLLALYVISPQDFRLHDDAPIKIDFRLRCLEALQRRLDQELNVPLAVLTVEKRKDIPIMLLEFMKRWEASHMFWNVEYEGTEKYSRVVYIPISIHFNSPLRNFSW